MLRQAIGAVAIILLGSSAAAQQPPPQTPPTQPGPIVVTGKKICETILKTGSILPKRICKTQAEWDEERAATARFVERLQRDQDVRTSVQMQKDLRAGR